MVSKNKRTTEPNKAKGEKIHGKQKRRSKRIGTGSRRRRFNGKPL
ncbi:MAG: 50S ribosomal protein L34 [Clostridiales bacterium]|nr:50S ribosomal protein L34 [Clostridiales bacterium]